jgi:hypothetical protein
MAPKLNRLFFFITLFIPFILIAQDNQGPRPTRITDYKNDSSYKNFNELRFKVAKAQINRLKNGGALLIRLKTNNNTISKLKAAGNIDLATQVERETQLRNKSIVRAYSKEFNFCPVYFFLSEFSDSVQKQKLNQIFVDSNLTINPTIVCSAKFYLVAEQGFITESSLGFVTEKKANNATERGAPVKEVAIVVKNRYFIELHKPFPYFQKGYSLKKNYGNYVKKFNNQLKAYYSENSSYQIPPEVYEFVY